MSIMYLTNQIPINVIEIIGICAFAASGAIVAINNKLDILGVIILGVINALGGGIIRDIILGITPPNFFLNGSYLVYIIISVFLTIAIFILACFKKTLKYIIEFDNKFIFSVADAIGLAAFCVLGADLAINMGFQGELLLVVTVGCITGTGGGVLRDIMIGQIPIIFKKRVYLLPAIIGTLLYVYLLQVSQLLAIIISMAFIITVRIFAVIFKWNLPSIK